MTDTNVSMSQTPHYGFPPDPSGSVRTIRDPGLATGVTRFPRLLIQQSYLDKLQAINEDTKVVIKHVKQDARVRRLGYHGVVENDPQYDLELSFSDDDGRSFSEPMFSITGNRIYQWRCGFGQLQASPLLHGVALLWRLPTGWQFTDGLGTQLYEECVSNPTIITRTMRSPSDPQPCAFEVDVVELFRY